MSEKHIFPVLFFKHEYLSNRKLYILNILGMTGKYSDLVNSVSEFLCRAWFVFYGKKWETSIQLIYIIDQNVFSVH